MGRGLPQRRPDMSPAGLVSKDLVSKSSNSANLGAMCRQVALQALRAAGMMSFFAGSVAQATEADCKAVTAAMLANTKTPYHSFTTIAIDYAAPMAEARRKMGLPTSQESEAIFTGTDLFLKLPTGKWINAHTSADKLLEQIRAATAKFSDCERLADETMEGGLRSVYTAHSDDCRT